MEQSKALAPTRTVIVSDLHLSQGWSTITGKLHRDEDFFFDDSFREFLEALHASSQPEQTVRVVIAGDFVDFLQVTRTYLDDDGRPASTFDGSPLTEREREIGLGSSPQKTVWKLDRVIEGHPGFFAAVADFLAKGHELIVLPGNHDIEWVALDVQTHFRVRLQELAGGDPDVAGRVSFHPWFFYDPACSLFVEHGCQYDGLNSFDTLLCPYLLDGHFNLPAGSFFVRYLFNQIEHVFPHADNMKPATRFLLWSLGQVRAWRMARVYVQFLRLTLEKARMDGSPENRAWLDECRSQQDEQVANLDSSGLDEEQLRHLMTLWVPSSLHAPDAGSLGLALSFLSKGSGPDHFAAKALQVGKITGARFVVFGHTHQAWLASADDGTTRYANSGTWTKCFVDSYERRLLEDVGEFAVVDIAHDDQAGGPAMGLKKWSRARGGFEPLLLFNTDEEEHRDLREPAAV
jgi:UDP-2,3-diacylglucosamine pyrophosphatase LpxH